MASVIVMTFHVQYVDKNNSHAENKFAINIITE